MCGCWDWLKRPRAYKDPQSQNAAIATETNNTPRDYGATRYQRTISCCFPRLRRGTVAWKAYEAAFTLALHTVFPVCAMGVLTERNAKRNEETLRLLQSGALVAPSVLIGGSQAEGLSLHQDWGHRIPDLDSMWLYGGSLCVHTHTPAEAHEKTFFQIDLRDVEPGYCRVHVEGDIDEMATMLSKIPVKRGSIRKSRATKCLEGGWLSSPRLFRALRDLQTGDGMSAGPADAQINGDLEFVPALVCTGPIETVESFVLRVQGNEKWPKSATLQVIRQVPTLIVAAGHGRSLNRDIEWRLSMSIPELLLAQDMPLWIKQVFWAFKYSMKTAIEKGLKRSGGSFVANGGGRKSVGSYHFKSILLWELEQRCWDDESPIILFINLIQRLEKCLASGILKHYFFAECNLLECVGKEELSVAGSAAKSILEDPLPAVFEAPKFPAVVYGEEDEGKKLLMCLKSLLAGCDGELIMDTGGEFELKKENLRRILETIDQVRASRWESMQNSRNPSRGEGPVTLTTLPGELFPPWGLRAYNA